MDFVELVKERYSVRSFDTKKVEKEKLDLILESARLAPTAANRQPQRILVLESDEALEKLKSCTTYHFNAPLALVVCVDTETSWKRVKFDGKSSSDIDASIITTHMMLQLHELGLGSTWVGFFDPVAIKEAYNIPDNLEAISILPVGYPSQDSKPSPMHTTRKELSEIVFYNKF